jgi:hypothetical protein
VYGGQRPIWESDQRMKIFIKTIVDIHSSKSTESLQSKCRPNGKNKAKIQRCKLITFALRWWPTPFSLFAFYITKNGATSNQG